MHSDITASIVVFKNEPRQVLRAIESFLAGNPHNSIYVLDNSPKDTLRRFLPENSRIDYIFNRKNLGFGVAHNIAIKKSQEAGAKFHLVLNPDVYFDPEVIPKLVSLMHAHPEIGSVMPKVLYPDGRLQYLCKLLPTPEHLFLRRFFPFNTKLFGWIDALTCANNST